ncbi:MAG: hypothetical protein K9M51_02630 [Candidatus Gracilibacteria bacterium]|nr:hypothetical protein [Candidatus Gracilibacteria bacterium]
MNDADMLKKIHDALQSAKASCAAAEKWARQYADAQGLELDPVRARAKEIENEEMEEDGDVRILEGIFDGQNMITPDNQKYPVPANYASKSKLVEGDKMKLMIQPNGAFVYKQIELIPRKLLTGKLILDGNQYKVLTDTQDFNVLYASVTFFHGKVGDTVTIILPEDGLAGWAAIENIIPADKAVEVES